MTGIKNKYSCKRVYYFVYLIFDFKGLAMLNKQDLSYCRSEFVYFVAKKSDNARENAFYSFWLEPHDEFHYYLYYKQGREVHTHIKVFNETSITFTFCTLKE